MDSFISRKRQRVTPPPNNPLSKPPDPASPFGEEDSTDIKLAILSSLHPNRTQEDLLEVLLSCDGSVDEASEALSQNIHGSLPARKRRATTIGLQSALAFSTTSPSKGEAKAGKPLTKKGKTLHLFTPADIAAHTPCSVIHNFLPPELANALIRELLPEAITFPRATFKLFENVVQSPHTACFYVDNLAERNRQKADYLYNGSNLDDIREILPVMRDVRALVQEAVNNEIATRIRDHYPGGVKLKYQSPQEWIPNAAFVNCYDGGAESVGYHSDQLSYLGPRAVIGSLSLGVARQFRVRKIVPKYSEPDEATINSGHPSTTTVTTKTPAVPSAADESGQIAIHLPHNSLLVMHAEMQEEWKHSIAPAHSIDPHPLAGNKRLNITYRWYRDSFHPSLTPKCRCGVPTVLKTVQRQRQNRGRYMWMCQTPGNPDGGKGCGFFEWAVFDEDGEPIWRQRDGGGGGRGEKMKKMDSRGSDVGIGHVKGEEEDDDEKAKG